MRRKETLLAETRAYEQALSAFIPESDRPLFHLTPMTGWMNDPNGFCHYNGEYHLFYQYYPYDTVWGPMHWGHAVSRDLVRWEYRPAALAPDTAADEGGCFSGSAVPLDDGRLMLVYTGVQKENAEHPERQAQCVAIGDGTDFVKCENNPVIAAARLPEGYSARDFRDPKAWRGADGRFYCVAGNRHETRQGAAVLFESENGLDWRFIGELDASRGEVGRMWECPDFFALDGTHVLLVSPQEMEGDAALGFHPGNNTAAVIGDYDETTHAFTRRALQPVDEGFEFYAPQTTLTPDGRRVMIAWMEDWETQAGKARTHKWFGRMTLPRELFMKDGRLCQRPVREIETLRSDSVSVQGALIDGDAAFRGVQGRAIDLTATLHIGNAACRRFEMRFAEDERHYTLVRCDLERGAVTFDRSMSGSRRNIPHTRTVKADCADGRLTLRLILDGDSAELFVGSGEHTVSALIDTPLTAEGISFHADGAIHVDIEKHALKK